MTGRKFGWRLAAHWNVYAAVFWVWLGQLPADEASDSRADASMIRQAELVIEHFHAGAPLSEAVIRIVYFHPSDRDPLPQWRSRLTRALDDVQSFYRDELRRLGATRCLLPFERDEDGFVFHLVKGRRPASAYDYDSGNEIEAEIRKATIVEIHFDREHVLILHGLCRSERDEPDETVYAFHSPYYGRGSGAQGVCHAADCERLDPRLFADTESTITYSEHYYPRVEQSLAKFNSWYLGGIAHELGHGIGLPHDFGSPPERVRRPGFALMGTGNHHYREDLWSGRGGAYLSDGSALRLLSSPLLTRSDRDRFEELDANLDPLQFGVNQNAMTIRGSIHASVPAYAVVAYLWRPHRWPGNPQLDHQSISYPALISSGQFELATEKFAPGDYRLRISTLHCNGAQHSNDFHLVVDRSGIPDVRTLNEDWLIRAAERAVRSGTGDAAAKLESIAATSPTGDAKMKLDILRDVLDPPVEVDLTTVSDDIVFLSDATWIQGQVGWGKVQRNLYSFDIENRNSIYIELNHRIFAKGLYAHSPSSFVFDLGGQWRTLTATIGLRDGAHAQGSAVFEVLADGASVYQSDVMRVGDVADISIDVSHVRQIELKATGGEGHSHNSWAVWASPVVSRSPRTE